MVINSSFHLSLYSYNQDVVRCIRQFKRGIHGSRRGIRQLVSSKNRGFLSFVPEI
jgi:hypothetical protein